ncbi:cell envelope integrity protein CreD [Methylosoma difficile]
MKQNFYLKLGVIFFLIMALMLPKAFMHGLIYERQNWLRQSFSSIEQSWPGPQTLGGPVITVPYQLTYQITETERGPEGEVQVNREVTANELLYIIPKQLKINSQVDSSLRYRGIYGVPVFGSRTQMQGEFSDAALLEIINANKNGKISFGKPELSILLSDQRGVIAPPTLDWDGQKITFQPGSALPKTEAGIHVALPNFDASQAKNHRFSIDLEVRGMRSVKFALLAEDTRLQLAGNWPHPSFTGILLPEQREVSEQGFSALWRASSFSYNVNHLLKNCRLSECPNLLQQTIGLDMIQPVDVYQQSERSIKYAELFILLTFMALILFELLKKVRIHPIQYTLVGMALLMFYLLLISLSEHLAFAVAYAIAATASTALLTGYFGGILGGSKLAWLLGAGLSGLYGALYVILQAEESALLMGSLLVFAVLAALMLSTRRFDWYALTNQTSRPKDDGVPL